MINMLILTNYMLVAFEIRYVQRLISYYGSDSFFCLCFCITWVLTFCPKVIRSKYNNKNNCSNGDKNPSL